MTTKKRFVATVFLVIITGITTANAQVTNTEDTAPPVIEVDRSEDRFSQALINTLSRHIDEAFMKTIPQDAFFPVCLALSIDKEGKITNVYTSLSLSATIKRFLKPGIPLLQAMQKTTQVYGQYRSKTIIFPIMFIKADASTIATNKEFVNNLENIWPDFPSDSSRPVVLIKPYVYRFAYPIRY
jgi:hypothetical protein